MSIATVSRVINNTGPVAPPTAARVREAVKQLGYVPNPLAQALGAGESRVIGLALPRFHGEFMTWLLHGADEEAARLGYHLMVTTITTTADGTRRRRIVGSNLIDAMLVVMTEQEDPLVADILASGIPAVVIDADMTARGLDSVVLDNESGTREAVEHLLRWTEPNRLYFVGGPRNNFDSARRAEAFAAALAASPHNHIADPEQIAMGDYSVDWGKEWAIRMHQQGRLGADAPTTAVNSGSAAAAVIAANDKIACGIMRAAEDLRIWVPDQLRVVGFNDSHMSRLVRPRLSTVSLPMADIGAAAVRMLVNKLDHAGGAGGGTGGQPPHEARCTRLPTKLIVRESSTAMNF